MGMWYGLTPTVNMVRIRKQFAELPLRAQIYAYEGLGFSVSLFHQTTEGKGGLEVAERLPFAAASAFAHGAGRAMWVKFGEDMPAFTKALSSLSERFRPDAVSGYGMGVGFTRIGHPDEFLRIGDEVVQATGQPCTSYLTGLSMGLGVRDTADRGFVAQSLGADPTAKRLRDVSLGVLKTLQDAQVEELHGNWRKSIRENIQNGRPAATPNQSCQVPS